MPACDSDSCDNTLLGPFSVIGVLCYAFSRRRRLLRAPVFSSGAGGAGTLRSSGNGGGLAGTSPININKHALKGAQSVDSIMVVGLTPLATIFAKGRY